MSRITKNRHKNNAFSDDLLKKMGILEITEVLKAQLKESEEASEEATNRIINPLNHE